MEIKLENPPNYEQIVKCFGEDAMEDHQPIFTHSGCIYNPHGIFIPEDLVAHEELHVKQQEEIGGSDIWWNKHTTDKEFRLDQEARAYGVQFAFLCKTHKDKNDRTRILWDLAVALVSPLYGKLCTHSRAMKLINEYAGL